MITTYGIEGLLAGRTLVDRYLVEEVIGRGGMGAVYRAKDTRLGREVAVKVVSVATSDAGAQARLRARFGREARAAAALHHPNVVAVHDFGTDPALGLDFLVMELLQGEDLASRLSRKGAPALSTALAVLHQAARGLAAGHRAGLIHRDVKPGNLFLEPGDRLGDVRVKVLDFGIAEIALDDQTLTHLTVAGRSPFSPAYASPEQMLGESRLLPATDVFSLGAVGFHLLTGQRAFTTSEPRRAVAELSAALNGVLPRVPRLPPGVRAILQKALAPRPAERYADAGAFADALAGYAEREPRTHEDEEGTRAAPTRLRTDERRAPEEPRRGFAEPPAGAATAYAPRETARPQISPELVQQAARLRQAQLPAPEPGRGWFRRAARAVWNFCVTTTSVALLAGSWTLAWQGADRGEEALIYAGIVASLLATPFAVHRLFGGRGSWRLAFVGCLLVTMGAVNLLEEQLGAHRLVAAVCALHLAASMLVERLTRRASPTPLAEPQRVPDRLV